MDRDAPLLAAPFLAASSQDDTEALERLYLRHRHDVYRIALRYGGGRSGWAEDVVQETFLGFLTSLPHYDEKRDMEAYLFSIAAHKLTRRVLRLRSEIGLFGLGPMQTAWIRYRRELMAYCATKGPKRWSETPLPV